MLPPLWLEKGCRKLRRTVSVAVVALGSAMLGLTADALYSAITVRPFGLAV